MTTINSTARELLSTVSVTPNAIQFSGVDYTIFSVMLGLSVLIGIYFGFIADQKQDNTEEYLLGSKNMSTFPISLSLIASHISGITLLGVPAEIYAYGTQYWVHIFSAIMIALLLVYIYLPVFYDLQLTSCFTYLEKRFDRRVRLTASAVYALSCLIFTPIVIYVPALAFNQVTGINVHIITPIISFICIFYTTVGGLKAVVWTDTLQFVLMALAMIITCFLGILAVGGFINVWRIADKGGRLIFFNMDPNPLVRTSFWTVSIGLTTTWLSNLGVNQASVQRFLAVPNIKQARRSVWIFATGLIVIKGFTCFTGLLMFAKYETCDPIQQGAVRKLDQMLPYFVMDVASEIPGLPGLFIAGIFSAALSSMSTMLNTLAGTIYEDFMRPRNPNASEKTASNWMKVLVIILGVIQLSLVFIVEKLGAIFSMALSLSGLTAGTLLGIFTIGMVYRKANTTGVIAGAITSFCVVLMIIIGAHSLPKFAPLPLNVDGCLNETIDSTRIETIFDLSPGQNIEDYHWLFRISFMYYSFIGVLIVFIVGVPVSLWTGGCQNVEEVLLTPLCRNKKFNPKAYKRSTLFKYNTVQYSIGEVNNSHSARTKLKE